MSTKSLVSVLLPVYNDETFLASSLRSIEAQTFSNTEIVVSDDDSSDNSREVAKTFAKHDSRFQVYAQPSNLGMTLNWNQALSHARGEYVMKLDSDDAFQPDTVRQLVVAMESHDQPFVAYCRTISCDENLASDSSYLGERALLQARVEPLERHCRSGHAWYRLAFNDLQPWHSNAQIHRRTMLEQMGVWDESWGCASDTDLILRVLERNQPIVHIPYAGVLYRHRQGSVSYQYRRHALLQWESSLLHLPSLSRYRLSRGKLTPALRQAWWRYWCLWQNLNDNQEQALLALRADARQRLLARARSAEAPPISVQAIGRMRQWLWNLRRACR